MTSEGEVIDLTESLMFEDLIIEINDSPIPKRTSTTKVSKKTSKKNRELLLPPPVENLEKLKKTRCTGFGDCPICWEELGVNPLASTKCGHVYCLKCLKRYMQQSKTCPSCRTTLKGSLAYHPIYLSRQ